MLPQQHLQSKGHHDTMMIACTINSTAREVQRVVRAKSLSSHMNLIDPLPAQVSVSSLVSDASTLREDASPLPQSFQTRIADCRHHVDVSPNVEGDLWLLGGWGYGSSRCCGTIVPSLPRLSNQIRPPLGWFTPSALRQ